MLNDDHQPTENDLFDLKKTAVFSPLSDEDIQLLEQKRKVTTYKKNQPIFIEGTHPAGVYCIHTGKIKVFTMGESGKEQIIRIASKGDVVGFRAIFSEDVFRLSATALEKCEVSFIKIDTFKEQIHINPVLLQSILKEISKESGERAEFIKTMAQKTVRERLAIILLVLEGIYKEEMINLTREDLANFVGTATETLIRLLRDFKDEELIEVHGRKIKLINVKNIYHKAGY